MCSYSASDATPSSTSLMCSSTCVHSSVSVIVFLFLERAAQRQQRARNALARGRFFNAAGGGYLAEAELTAVTQEQGITIAGPYPLQERARLLGTLQGQLIGLHSGTVHFGGAHQPQPRAAAP